ncbi:hypothetical protein GWK47_045263 [Chionoecetes opilio]|uniref:Uncharacterized protein n=1 Tax=Chionoecetes opilio TaxID=41210 RepID=A0A8J5CX23_CHIOP|nr:hypothetical protein GWK47_045263 [Chionoecetes opilio]
MRLWSSREPGVPYCRLLAPGNELDEEEEEKGEGVRCEDLLGMVTPPHSSLCPSPFAIPTPSLDQSPASISPPTLPSTRPSSSITSPEPTITPPTPTSSSPISTPTILSVSNNVTLYSEVDGTDTNVNLTGAVQEVTSPLNVQFVTVSSSASSSPPAGVKDACHRAAPLSLRILHILRDLRQGLLRTERPMRETAIFYTKGTPYQDDTYMYDDDVGGARGAGAGVGVLGPPHHWYDEPPYESDPEDFLIGKDAYREPFHSGLRVVVTEEDIISLRTAGDISVPRDVAKVAHAQWAAGERHAYPVRAHAQGGEALYQGGGAFPVPVYDNVRLVSVGGGRPVGRGSRRSEPGSRRSEPADYHNMEGTARGGIRRPRRPLLRDGGPPEDLATADVHSVTSRLSGVSVETNRSDPTELRLSKYLVPTPHLHLHSIIFPPPPPPPPPLFNQHRLRGFKWLSFFRVTRPLH